ncbi:magnesium transporter [Catelliglobosispora koreensis]|uniref:magnesium transporter n=1 Tax=Catelliglobosispora koreensis TaxID=129052 RepID=UPI0003A01832|nr:magnesium transporter [Catelliglobosispora koreensis]
MTIDDQPLLGTAAWHASRNVPVASPSQSAADALAGLVGQDFDSASVVAVCEDGRLAGLVTIERLLSADPRTPLSQIMDSDPPVIAPGTDQEHAAWKAVQHAEPGLAVVDDDGRFIGLISAKQLLRVLLEEHDEDMARIGGYVRSGAAAREASVESVPRRLLHRLPWLGVGLVGVLASAGVLAAFEERLSAQVAVAFFLPGIIYLGAAVGNQTQTLAVRGLSVGVGIKAVAAREALTGALVGAVLAAAMYAVVAVGWREPALAVVVALAVLAASTAATLVGMFLPWVLQRAGKDPAFGSGPVATIIQDLTSLSIYMLLVTALL